MVSKDGIQSCIGFILLVLKFYSRCKKLLGFNFWHQKLKTKSIRLLVSNFQHRKLRTKSPILWVFNFWHRKLNAKSLVQLSVQLLHVRPFFCFFYVNWIHPKCFHHSFGLILLINTCIFQVSFQNKVNLVLVNIPSNLLIPHVFEPLSSIP